MLFSSGMMLHKDQRNLRSSNLFNIFQLLAFDRQHLTDHTQVINLLDTMGVLASLYLDLSINLTIPTYYWLFILYIPIFASLFSTNFFLFQRDIINNNVLIYASTPLYPLDNPNEMATSIYLYSWLYIPFNFIGIREL